MSIEMVTKFVDSDTKNELDLRVCACGNNAFYVTTNDVQICACCNMTSEEAIQAHADMQEI
jgi:hypothetical protein